MKRITDMFSRLIFKQDCVGLTPLGVVLYVFVIASPLSALAVIAVSVVRLYTHTQEI